MGHVTHSANHLGIMPISSRATQWACSERALASAILNPHSSVLCSPPLAQLASGSCLPATAPPAGATARRPSRISCTHLPRLRPSLHPPPSPPGTPSSSQSTTGSQTPPATRSRRAWGPPRRSLSCNASFTHSPSARARTVRARTALRKITIRFPRDMAAFSRPLPSQGARRQPVPPSLLGLARMPPTGGAHSRHMGWAPCQRPRA
jgi:hypothetical protein